MTRNWFDELATRSDDEHPVSREAERRLRQRRAYRTFARQARTLENDLARSLADDTKHLWLELDTATNHRWAMTAEEYFNLGVDYGLAQRLADDVLAAAGADAALAPAQAVRALASALLRVAERLG